MAALEDRYALARYIIGSPALNAVDRAVEKLEAAHAAARTDLAAHVFLGAGEREVEDMGMAAWGIVGSTATLAETLRLRQYPSLRLKTRFFPDKDHMTVIADLLSEEVRWVWADAVAGKG